MNRNIKKIIPLLMAFATMVFLFAACVMQNEDGRQHNVYNAYVAYAEEQGEEVLTYEQWLESIKGERGEKGDAGTPGERGEKGETGAAGARGRTGFAVCNEEALKAAAKVDESYIVLCDDVDLSEGVVITGRDVILDLNGKKLYNGEDI